MARGIPRKWVTAHIKQPVELGKSGVKVIIWDKWRPRRRGTVVVSVGGIRWYSYKAKKAFMLSWDKFEERISATHL